MTTFLQMQTATLDARKRLGDKTIGTCIKQGRIQVVKVTYPKGEKSVVTPVSDWMPVSEVCGFLDGLTA